MSTTPIISSAYGPCSPAVSAVLGRAASLNAIEIIGLAQARELCDDPDLWNAAVDALADTAVQCDRHATILAVAAEAQRLTWLAAKTATQLPDMARLHVVNHGPAFGAATEAAARLAAIAAMSAALADRISPSVSGVLCAPWRQVTETATPTSGALS